jgi:hypothetical protein
VATSKKEAKIARTSLLFFLDMEMYWPAWVIFFGFLEDSEVRNRVYGLSNDGVVKDHTMKQYIEAKKVSNVGILYIFRLLY